MSQWKQKFKQLIYDTHFKSDADGPELVFFYGPACSGKTTLSKMLADEFGLLRVSIDTMRFIYYKDKIPVFDPANRDRLFCHLCGYIGYLLKHKQKVVSEALLIAPYRKNLIFKIARRYGARCCFFYVHARLNELEQRLENRIGNGKNSEQLMPEKMTIESVRFFYSISEQPKRKGLIVDTGHSKITDSYQRVRTSYQNPDFNVTREDLDTG